MYILPACTQLFILDSEASKHIEAIHTSSEGREEKHQEESLRRSCTKAERETGTILRWGCMWQWRCGDVDPWAGCCESLWSVTALLLGINNESVRCGVTVDDCGVVA